MGTHNLRSVFAPSSLAVVGASPRARSLGRNVLRQIRDAGFPGPVGLVNPRHDAIDGVAAVPALADLGFVPELVVVAAPPDDVPRVIAEAAALGTRAGIVLTRALGHGPGSLADAMLAAAHAHGMRLVGPNCLGVIAPHAKLAASFAAHAPRAGDLALVSQSGAVAAGMIEWSHARDIGYSAVVSLGEAVDVDFADLLDHFALDPHTRAILLHVERIRDARKFMSAARAAARAKPVVVIKPRERLPRDADGVPHADARTDAARLAGPDAGYDAAFRRAGLLRVHTLEELFAAAETLSRAAPLRGRRLAVLGNGAGTGVIALDRLDALGGEAATLDPATIATLDRELGRGLPCRNPVDLFGDAEGARYGKALGPLLQDPNTDAVLALHVPTVLSPPRETAAATVEALRAHPSEAARKPVLGVWIGEDPEAIRMLNAAGVPTYPSEADAVRGFMDLARHRDARMALMETPPSLPADFTVDASAARRVVDAALADGDGWLDADGVAAVLAAYGIAMAPPGAVADPDFDTGATFPPLIAGLADDPVFGPLVVFGRGGTAVEVIDDRAVALPPLDLRLAHETIGRTRVSRILRGYRDVPAADLRAVALLLVKLAQLAADLPEVREVEVNPLRVGRDGVVAAGARIAVAPSRVLHKGRFHPRLAVRPYPSEWERDLALADGRVVRVRPVRPEDDAMFREFFTHVSAEDLRLRFFQSVREFSHEFIARLVQLDYARSIALCAIDPMTGGLLGAVRLHSDADYVRGEYGIMVRSDLKGAGLGWRLMTTMIDYARWLGLRVVEGQVLRENTTMLAMCRQLGFAVRADPDDPGVMLVELPVDAALPAA